MRRELRDCAILCELNIRDGIETGVCKSLKRESEVDSRKNEFVESGARLCLKRRLDRVANTIIQSIYRSKASGSCILLYLHRYKL